MQLKKSLFYRTALIGLFFSPCLSMASKPLSSIHRRFPRLSITIDNSSYGEILPIIEPMDTRNTHLIKKALYNNHHKELQAAVKPSNVNMILSPDAQSDGGETLLMYACRGKSDGELPNENTVVILLEKQADPFLYDAQGNTALIYAAKAGVNANNYGLSMALASTLIAYAHKRNAAKVPAYIKHTNQAGQSATSIAASQGNTHLAEYLKEYRS